MNKQEISKIKPGDLFKSPRTEKIFLVLGTMGHNSSLAFVFCLKSKVTYKIDFSSVSYYKAINQNWVICE